MSDYVDCHHGVGSNFCRANIILYSPVLEDWVSWPANENYFQCAKLFEKQPTRKVEDLHQEIRLAPPREAKRLGRTVKLTKSELLDWDQVRAPVAMLTCNLAKYQQNPHCLQWLKSTRGKRIVEHCSDKTWGDGMDGAGLNLLGLILELVRVRLC